MAPYGARGRGLADFCSRPARVRSGPGGLAFLALFRLCVFNLHRGELAQRGAPGDQVRANSDNYRGEALEGEHV
jgi:hypothetical protein